MTKMASKADLELDRIRAEISHETELIESLDHSLEELKHTTNEIDRKSDHDSNSEWKIRYETQVEINKQLDVQSLLLAEKLDEAKRVFAKNKKQRGPTMEEDSDLTIGAVRSLEKMKKQLEAQLRDLEWRLDQESKAYHKANEERKQYNLDMSAARSMLGASTNGLKLNRSVNLPAPANLPLQSSQQPPQQFSKSLPQLTDIEDDEGVDYDDGGVMMTRMSRGGRQMALSQSMQLGPTKSTQGSSPSRQSTEAPYGATEVQRGTKQSSETRMDQDYATPRRIVAVATDSGRPNRQQPMTARQNESKDLIGGGASSSPPAIGNVNIAQNRRTIDSRRGPMKKTAAVKNLPPL